MANDVNMQLGQLSPKQEEFYYSTARYTCYGGARGGGKTQERWYDGVYDEGEERGYQESMSRLVEFRAQICVENIAAGASNKVTGWIFLSKQKLWGGFQDSIQRTETSGKQDIKITIAGADGKPLKHGK